MVITSWRQLNSRAVPMKLVSGNAIGHFLPCHPNGWRAQLFKPSSTRSKLESNTETLNHSINKLSLHKRGYIIQIILFAMFKHIVLILEWIDICILILLQLYITLVTTIHLENSKIKTVKHLVKFNLARKNGRIYYFNTNTQMLWIFQ